jgi:hypothetical protein
MVNGSRSRFPRYVLFPLRGGPPLSCFNLSGQLLQISKSRTSLSVPSRTQRRPPWAWQLGRAAGASEDRRLEVSTLELANRIGLSSITCPACHRTNEHRQAAIFHESEPIAGRLAAPSTCCCPLRYHVVRLSLHAAMSCDPAMTVGVPISRTLFQLPLKGRPGVGPYWPCIIEALNGALSARGSDIVLTALLNP